MKKIILTLCVIAAVSFAIPQTVAARGGGHFWGHHGGHHGGGHGDPQHHFGGGPTVETPLDGGVLALLFGAGAAFTAYKKRKMIKA